MRTGTDRLLHRLGRPGWLSVLAAAALAAYLLVARPSGSATLAGAGVIAYLVIGLPRHLSFRAALGFCVALPACTVAGWSSGARDCGVGFIIAFSLGLISGVGEEWRSARGHRDSGERLS